MNSFQQFNSIVERIRTNSREEYLSTRFNDRLAAYAQYRAWLRTNHLRPRNPWAVCQMVNLIVGNIEAKKS